MITILDIAKQRGVQSDSDGSIPASEFAKVGLPFMGGCQHCHATIACYNAVPLKNGYLSREACAEGASDEWVYTSAQEAEMDIFGTITVMSDHSDSD